MIFPKLGDGNGAGKGAPALERARKRLHRLRESLIRRLPAIAGSGPEDPVWVLLEVFAEAVAELEADVEGLEDRLFPRLVEALGEEPRWARAARGAVVFTAAEDVAAPVLVPRGTVVAAERRGEALRLAFETAADAWAGPGRLLRVAAVAGERHREILPYPHNGWDAGPVPLFGNRLETVRHLYLGDPLLGLLRAAGGSLVLEWSGVSSALVEGRWEYSIRGGWQRARVEFEEARAGGRRVLRVRILGPLAALADERLEGGVSPWLRVALEGDRRLLLRPPQWVAAELRPDGPLEPGGGGAAAVSPSNAPVSPSNAPVSPSNAPVSPSNAPGGGRAVAGGGAAAALLSFPRPVARLLSAGGERWEDHSLLRERFQPAASSADWDPAVYFGWDRAASASVFWEAAASGLAALQTGWVAPASSLVRPPPATAGAGAPRLVWEFSTGRGYRRLDVADGTAAFTRSGCIVWSSPPGWQAQEALGERLWWLRARWVAGGYPRPPAAGAVLPHAAEVRQGRTVEQHIVDAVLNHEGRGVVALSFPDGEPERFAEAEIRAEGADWRRLESFHVRRRPQGDFVLDAGAGWTGAVRLKILRLRIGLGARGNAPPGTLRVLETDLPGIRAVEQPLATDGAADGEDAAAFRERVVAEWKSGDRAVTAADFLLLCRALDPVVERVEAARDPECPCRLVVTVCGTEADNAAGAAGGGAPWRPSPARLQRLEEELGRRVPLGTVVEVVAPLFVRAEVVGRAAEGVRRPPPAVHGELEAEIRRTFDPVRGGADGKGFPKVEWWREEVLAGMLARVFSRSSAVAGAALAADAAWDPRAWRFTVRFPDESGGVLPLPAAELGTAVIFPRLERLVFEPLDGK